MKKATTLWMTVAAFGFAGAAVQAQQSTFDSEGNAASAVENLEEQIADDRDRDLDAFGNAGRKLGSYGSLSARATATNDDEDDVINFGLGLRFGNYNGTDGWDVSVGYNYGEANGDEVQNNLVAGLDYRRDLNANLFAFGQLDVAFDGLAEDDGDFESDTFIGAGVGYRIFNDAQTQWSVQAGPGYRVANVIGDDDLEEAALAVSSNYFRSLSETSFVTNDTDVIASENSTLVNNELALSVAVSSTLSLRTSLTTQFNDATDEGFDDARNTLGVSVVYNFN